MNHLLKVEDLSVSYKMEDNYLKALDSINFSLNRGESLAIVGESGSGKSTLAKTLVGLNPERSCDINSGKVYFRGYDLLKLSQKDWRKYRGKEISIIFQDPLNSLNPTMRVGEQIVESFLLHNPNSNKVSAKANAIELLIWLGIENAENRFFNYPHQFSGGMLQRIMIAIALAASPKILIADEPTSALDPRIQIQILTLLKKIQTDLGTSIILITHDLSIAGKFTEKTIVMYSGSIVEAGLSGDVFSNPSHPYTKKLLECVPRLNTDKSIPLKPICGKNLPHNETKSGCAFQFKCDKKLEICEKEKPKLKDEVACFLYDQN
jgi:oligopeptide/dipeptide ABC transporter ATP-binding protein